MRGRRGASAGLARYLPAVEWLAGYQGPWLRGDLWSTPATHPRVLVLDLDAVPDIDVTALDLLPSFDADLRERSITLWLANPNDRPLDMLRRLPDADAWERRLFGDLDAAAAAHSSSSGDEPRPGRPPR